jgi:Gpi18-like mannosyltransferase
MRAFFTIAFFAILVLCTLFAARTWYVNRGKVMEDAERRVFLRFVAGLAVFWLVAIAGYFGGFISATP